MKKDTPFRQIGYTLLEIMLGLAILMMGVLVVYALMKPASLKAGVEKEQKHLSALASGVQSAFGSTQGHYGDLSIASLSNVRLQGVKVEEGSSLRSALGDNMLLRPATVRESNDAFDVIYENIDTQKCLHYIQSFYPQTYTILVGSAQTPVQETSGASEGRLVGNDLLTQACSNREFKEKRGDLTFRFFTPRSVSVSATDQVCGCTPETQTQTLSCADGQTGSIEQQRTSTCTGGTGACPTAVWSAWTTTSNTCSGGSTPIGPSVVVDPSDGMCVEGNETRTSSCPAGQTGAVTETRPVTCASPSASPTYGAWVITQNTCTTPTSTAVTCTPSTQTQNVACPSGQGGQITQTRSSSCSAPNATPVWGNWVETSRNCSIECVEAGNCCKPEPNQNRLVSCQDGFYGQSQEERSSYCSSATSLLQWNGWVSVSSTCTACPAPQTTSETQWVPASSSCPSGESGSVTWEKEQSRSETVSYACPAGTLVLPAPNTSQTGWVDTGNTRNLVNTCATSCTPPPSSSTPITKEEPKGTQTIGCPDGYTGSIEQERTITQNGTKTTTWSCPGPSSSETETWDGTFNYGDWVTVNTTCTPISAPQSKVEMSCTRSYRTGQPASNYRIRGYFTIGDTYAENPTGPDLTFADPSDWNITWQGLPQGGEFSLAARPYTNVQPNSLSVDGQCPTNSGDFGYRATYTKISTGQTYTSTFRCQCTNLGY